MLESTLKTNANDENNNYRRISLSQAPLSMPSSGYGYMKILLEKDPIAYTCPRLYWVYDSDIKSLQQL